MARFGKPKHPPVSWSELPHKDQLLLLILARFSEPLTMSSIRSYMYYQLKSFDQTQSDAAISSQAGYMTSIFMFAQFLTAFWWGRAADSEYLGRKRVLLIGLIGTGISAIGFGFSTSFWMAMGFRMIGGMLNGNVGVMRTVKVRIVSTFMLGRILIRDRYQSRAFMLMPMTGNIGQIIGPIIGGFLADPVSNYPGLFGKNSFFGGDNGVQWMIHYPYALPNLLSACFLIGSGLIVLLALKETHPVLKERPDWGIELRKLIMKKVFKRQEQDMKYMPVPTDESAFNPFTPEVELQETPVSSPTRIAPRPPVIRKKTPQKLPFRRIFTRNVVLTLLSRGLLAMHVGTFNNLWYIFLSTPRDPESNSGSSGFRFNGGLGLPPNRIGIVLSIIGGLGIAMQLIIYPSTSQRFGTMICYRASLVFFPVAYFLAPFLVLLPSSSLPPLPASGFIIWTGILSVLFIWIFAKTFAMPSAVILVNNCCPHPSVLSTIHGISQSVASGMRMLGPVMGGWGFALALQIRLVIFPFWTIMVLSALAVVFSLALTEGDGHEVKLEGEEEEFEEAEKDAAEANDVEVATDEASKRDGLGLKDVHTP
ncbi:MFS general substrate transporter [Microthyrium microscopicum]|uniref:MFS general substrate transporter n=1 Tax=Microthyrium microscopicum TaxID=703497 RepID=A0A6A6UQC6_9PEZI|nr:MFS general substrate transporter [Microthyrium microscopicum]